jgi:hypothetical protein
MNWEKPSASPARRRVSEGPKWIRYFFLALANCSNFELGSLDVVRMIFGSIIPALEYSLSM